MAGKALKAEGVAKNGKKVKLVVKRTDGEYQVRVYEDGKYKEGPSYYTNDKADASATFNTMKKEYGLAGLGALGKKSCSATARNRAHDKGLKAFAAFIKRCGTKVPKKRKASKKSTSRKGPCVHVNGKKIGCGKVKVTASGEIIVGGTWIAGATMKACKSKKGRARASCVKAALRKRGIKV